MERRIDEIKLELSEPVPVHFHGGNPEPHLTPLSYKAIETLHADALALIQRLQEKNDAMHAEIVRLQAERDAAVKDLSECCASHCPYCKNWEKPGRAVVCINCRNGAPRCKQHFEWRGVQKEG